MGVGSLSFSYLVTTFFFVSIFETIGCNSELNKDNNGTKLLFIFGDSIFDAGNNPYVKHEGRALGTYWPYGMNFHNHSTGRISDGLLIPDLIAQNAKLGFIPPYLEPGASFKNGVNFASAGSGVMNSSITEFINIREQLSNFKKVVASLEREYGEAGSKNIIARSVYLFSTGGNDYWRFKSTYPNSTQSQGRRYVHAIVGNLTDVLKEMYVIGIRKVAFLSVGPVGCYPLSMQNYSQGNSSSSTCVASLSKLGSQHNKALTSVLKHMGSLLPGFKYSFFDYYHAIRDRMMNPTKFGFKEGRVACCGGGGKYNALGCGGGTFGTDKYTICSNVSDHIMFDGGHHTQATNHQLAALFWNDGAPKITRPNTLKQLFEYP